MMRIDQPLLDSAKSTYHKNQFEAQTTFQLIANAKTRKDIFSSTTPEKRQEINHSGDLKSDRHTINVLWNHINSSNASKIDHQFIHKLMRC
jgi:hypothetical protein